jgi:hypothetical protein
MNEARGRQVLQMIDESLSTIESESERLALLLAECRREKYWKLRGFSCEADWIRITFPQKSLRTIRGLATLGQAYGDYPEILSEIGTAKAYTIKGLKHRKFWINRALELSMTELVAEIKRMTSRIKTPLQAKRRIAILNKKLERMNREIKIVNAEINELKTRWNGVSLDDVRESVCGKTIKKWKNLEAGGRNIAC